METKKIRQPIVTFCGHVDHGKTSLLDALRGTSIHEKEAGGITQKISFTLYPLEQLKKSCPLIEKQKINLNIPGFLFIDTPGHAAFTNLRKRGGNLADVAILVIDINEGIKPQTAEVIQILKINKVPFVIALNKIDKIHGWKTGNNNVDLKKRIESQARNTSENFQEKYLTIIGSLQSYGFDSDIFYGIDDFTKKVALVPCSARTNEGIQELLLVLCGLSQKYLKERLALGRDAKGIILEIKKDQSNYIEAILYDGVLSKKDEIAVSGLDGKPIVTRIRVLEEILPLSSKFQPKDQVVAATGLRLEFVSNDKAILPGMPFVIFKKNREEIEKSFKQEISQAIKTDKQGIIAKADSLGSLEALLTILSQEKIFVLKAGIGNVNKTDVANAKANIKINKIDASVVGFNVSVEPDAVEKNEEVEIILDDVIYRLIEKLKEFREKKQQEIERKRLLGLNIVGKIKILHQYVFRNSNPAIFGIKVEAGKITAGVELIDEQGEKVAKIKHLQSEGKELKEAREGEELAISLPGVNFERVLGDKNFLYTNLSQQEFKNFMKNKDLLSSSEIKVLQEIERIKKLSFRQSQ